MFYGTYKLMMNRFDLSESRASYLSTVISGYATNAGRRRSLRTLLNKSDRELADMGFNRELLNQGVKSWPWRIASDRAAETPTLVSASTLDIRRPLIEEVLLHGDEDRLVA